MFNYNSLFMPIEEKGINFIPLLLISIIVCLPWSNYLEKCNDNKIILLLILFFKSNFNKKTLFKFSFKHKLGNVFLM